MKGNAQATAGGMKERKNDSAIAKRLQNMEVRFDESETIVVDLGSGFIKAGHAGEDLPRVVIPTVLGERQMQAVEDAVNNPNNDNKPKITHAFGADAY
jgi:hypothetical protein